MLDAGVSSNVAQGSTPPSSLVFLILLLVCLLRDSLFAACRMSFSCKQAQLRLLGSVNLVVFIYESISQIGYQGCDPAITSA